jgi:hypothetical protein
VLLTLGVVLLVLGLAKVLFDIDMFAWVVSRFP